MTNAERKCIENAIDNFETRENRLTNEYIRIHPEDAERRQRDRDMIFFAAELIRTEIKEELDKCLIGKCS